MSSQVTSRNLVKPCWRKRLLQRVPKNTSPAIGLVSEMLWHCTGSGASPGHLVQLQLELKKGWVLRPLGCLRVQKKLSTEIMCHPNCGVFLEIDKYSIWVWGAFVAEVIEILALRSERIFRQLWRLPGTQTSEDLNCFEVVTVITAWCRHTCAGTDKTQIPVSHHWALAGV